MGSDRSLLVRGDFMLYFTIVLPMSSLDMPSIWKNKYQSTESTEKDQNQSTESIEKDQNQSTYIFNLIHFYHVMFLQN